MITSEQAFMEAFETRSITTFMRIVFPPEWASIAARIIESGATMSEDVVPWAPRWTPVSPTKRYGDSDHETRVKSCIYRAHDCLHNLWGLPVPTDFSDESRRLYKRAQMCGEVSVLGLTEFALCESMLRRWPDLAPILIKRNALPLLHGPLARLSLAQLVGRLDRLLHAKLRPRWVRENHEATAFVDDYVPMLEEDRRLVDHNWELMKRTKWLPGPLPNARYSDHMDGSELTAWMIEDFEHLLSTDAVVDEPLAEFNRDRRSHVRLPEGWNE